MGTHWGEVMPRVTGHCEGVSLTECWGDTTTGHLMCECPLASHNHSAPDTRSRSRSQRLSRRSETERRRQWSQNNN